MSEKGKAKRAAYEKKQETRGKNVVKWIGIVLFVLAIITLIWSFSFM
jgi:hypothetical protein